MLTVLVLQWVYIHARGSIRKLYATCMNPQKSSRSTNGKDPSVVILFDLSSHGVAMSEPIGSKPVE